MSKWIGILHICGNSTNEGKCLETKMFKSKNAAEVCVHKWNKLFSIELKKKYGNRINFINDEPSDDYIGWHLDVGMFTCYATKIS